MTTPVSALRHVAVIPDGNRRWAKQHGLPTFKGHQRGAEMVEKILDEAYKRGIHYFTFWGCSIDNVTKRDPKEVKFLYILFERYFKKLLKSKVVHERKVRIRVLGAWADHFPASLKKVIEQMMEVTKDYTDINLTFLMAYSGFDEMTKAIDSMARTVVTPESIKKHLFTKDLPAVDLVVRTGGEPHWSSGFMMWDAGDALLYFTEVLWPEFTPVEFGKAIAWFEGTERRKGK